MKNFWENIQDFWFAVVMYIIVVGVLLAASFYHIINQDYNDNNRNRPGHGQKRRKHLGKEQCHAGTQKP